MRRKPRVICEEAYLSVVEAGSKVAAACRHHLLSQQSNLDAIVTALFHHSVIQMGLL